MKGGTVNRRPRKKTVSSDEPGHIDIDQLTARGVMDASALYEPPFTNLHAGGPDGLFAGKENVIEGIFEKLKAVHSGLIGNAG